MQRKTKSSGRLWTFRAQQRECCCLLRVGRMEMTGGGSSALLFQGLRGKHTTLTLIYGD